jgi:hypothetical protein
MLCIKNDGYLDKPVITCDVCGKVFKDAKEGSVWFDDGSGKNPMPLVFACEGLCSQKVESQGTLTCDLPLDWVLFYLSNNIKMFDKETKVLAGYGSLIRI